MKADLSQSERLVSEQAVKPGQLSHRVFVQDVSPRTKQTYTPFGNRVVAIVMQEMPSKTIERDLTNFFGEQQPTVTGNSSTHLVARIEKSDAYWLYPVSARIPLAGIVTSALLNYTFVFDVKVVFELVENNKVIWTYRYTDKVEITDGDAALSSGIEKSWARVILIYRDRMFKKLNGELLPPLLLKHAHIANTHKRIGSNF